MGDFRNVDEFQVEIGNKFVNSINHLNNSLIQNMINREVVTRIENMCYQNCLTICIRICFLDNINKIMYYNKLFKVREMISTVWNNKGFLYFVYSVYNSVQF